MEHKDPELTVVDEREMAGLLLAGPGDDGISASASWRTIAETMGIEHVELDQRVDAAGGPRVDSEGSIRWGSGLHPTRAGEAGRAWRGRKRVGAG